MLLTKIDKEITAEEATIKNKIKIFILDKLKEKKMRIEKNKISKIKRKNKIFLWKKTILKMLIVIIDFIIYKDRIVFPKGENVPMENKIRKKKNKTKKKIHNILLFIKISNPWYLSHSQNFWLIKGRKTKIEQIKGVFLKEKDFFFENLEI